jgi:hypothetical protein
MYRSPQCVNISTLLWCLDVLWILFVLSSVLLRRKLTRLDLLASFRVICRGASLRARVLMLELPIGNSANIMLLGIAVLMLCRRFLALPLRLMIEIYSVVVN